MNDAARRQAELLLERNEDISGASFAGTMAQQTDLGLNDALGLYEELTGAETPREIDSLDEKDNTPDDSRPVLEEALAVTGCGGGSSSSPFAEHFERVAGVYTELGTIGELRSVGNYDFTGWYNTRETGTESNWSAEGRVFNLAEEYDAIRERLDRTVYTTINYVDREWFDSEWTGYNWVENDDGDSNRVWDGGDREEPTPGYEDIHAYAPFADIDLDDSVKYDRPDGEIPKDAVEDALERYIDAFAQLAGGREHVYALDSVGGTYVMVAPTSTTPIAATFDDPDERAAIFAELAKRANEWLMDTREEINAAVPARDRVAGYPDDHSDAVAGIVRRLWHDYAEDADGWEDALRTWLDEKKAEAEERRRRIEENAERRRERLDELGTTATGQPITPHMQDVIDAVDSIDIRQLVKSHCREWEPTGRADHFNPGPRLWKESDSGTSCFVNTSRNMFFDVGENGGEGGPAKFMALKEGAISSPGQDASGEPFCSY